MAGKNVKCTERSESGLPVKKDRIISEVIRRIERGFSPLKIYLFGSRAWRRARKGSDYDLMIIVEEEDELEDLEIEIRVLLHDLPASFDIIVEGKKWWEEWSDTPFSLERKVRETGVLIYG